MLAAAPFVRFCHYEALQLILRAPKTFKFVTDLWMVVLMSAMTHMLKGKVFFWQLGYTLRDQEDGQRGSEPSAMKRRSEEFSFLIYSFHSGRSIINRNKCLATVNSYRIQIKATFDLTAAVWNLEAILLE
ncbi:hypothetical protein ACFX15_014206 [Malus domestica]